MEVVKLMISSVVEILKFPMEIWGFHLSFWSIGLTMIAASIVIWLVVRFFE